MTVDFYCEYCSHCHSCWLCTLMISLIAVFLLNAYWRNTRNSPWRTDILHLLSTTCCSCLVFSQLTCLTGQSLRTRFNEWYIKFCFKSFSPLCSVSVILLVVYHRPTHQSRNHQSTWAIYSTNKPCFLCHPSRLSSLYSSKTLFFPSGQRTHAGLELLMTQTISSGTGSSVSIADAKGWINSGQWWSQSQSMVLQLEQKFLSDEQSCWLGLPRSLIALYFLVKTENPVSASTY